MHRFLSEYQSIRIQEFTHENTEDIMEDYNTMLEESKEKRDLKWAKENPFGIGNFQI